MRINRIMGTTLVLFTCFAAGFGGGLYGGTVKRMAQVQAKSSIDPGQQNSGDWGFRLGKLDRSLKALQEDLLHLYMEKTHPGSPPTIPPADIAGKVDDGQQSRRSTDFAYDLSAIKRSLGRLESSTSTGGQISDRRIRQIANEEMRNLRSFDGNAGKMQSLEVTLRDRISQITNLQAQYRQHQRQVDDLVREVRK